MLKTIIKAVLYLSKQELAFRGIDESTNSFNRGSHRKPLKCFSKLDSVCEHHLHRKLADTIRSHLGVFTGVSSESHMTA